MWSLTPRVKTPQRFPPKRGSSSNSSAWKLPTPFLPDRFLFLSPISSPQHVPMLQLWKATCASTKGCFSNLSFPSMCSLSIKCPRPLPCQSSTTNPTHASEQFRLPRQDGLAPETLQVGAPPPRPPPRTLLSTALASLYVTAGVSVHFLDQSGSTWGQGCAVYFLGPIHLCIPHT